MNQFLMKDDTLKSLNEQYKRGDYIFTEWYDYKYHRCIFKLDNFYHIFENVIAANAIFGISSINKISFEFGITPVKHRLATNEEIHLLHRLYKNYKLNKHS